MTDKLKIELNNYLSNNAVFYIKLHNLHWNVSGINFKIIHEYLETIYDSISIVLDEVAEVIKMQNEFPLASMNDYLEKATIKEISSVNYKGDEVLEITRNDIKILINQAECIRTISSDDDNYSIATMLEDHLANLNKTLWFLDSMKK